MTQREALAIMEAGRSVLLTGAAGSGKTYLLDRFIRRARQAGSHVAVTATTGLAATHLGGTTIHGWSGIGVADTLPNGSPGKLSKSRQATIQRADILVIDEISMLHDFRLDMVDTVCCEVRDDPAPFGGLQVILCGDFFQLPPVNRQGARGGGFVTGSRAWLDGHFTVLYLEEQHRQSGDPAFAELLNALRGDRLTAAQRATLNGRIGARLAPGLAATRLHTVNVDVDRENELELAKLPGEEQTYAMTTAGRSPYVERLRSACLAPQTLRLKTGALVMFIKNAPDRQYANGSLGEVTGFEEATNRPIVKLARRGRSVTVEPDSWELLDGDRRRAELTQLPLRLAWAITVHKSQGMTLDATDVDLRRAFEPGMGYVALSRVGGLERLTLRGLGRTALAVSGEALAIDAALREASTVAVRVQAAAIAAAPQREGSPAVRAVGRPAAPGVPPADMEDRFAKLRETHPNAYRAWLEADDEKLRRMFDDGAGLNALCAAFGRQPGSIRARLKRHYGEEVIVRP